VPHFFATPAAWRSWLAAHHASEKELLVGFHKRDSGKPSITWPESVDEALCFGWIDGVRRRIDELSYSIRFTPRRATSIWSAVNLRRYAELEAAGRVEAAGRAVFAARDPKKSGLYSFEQRKQLVLPDELRAKLEKNKKAAAFFAGQAPWYQRAVTHWIASAKQEATRERRLAVLIEDSAAGRRIKPLDRTPK
jgi:uncharacterized protein YdeI (YjbR/CyaY-like superfamily)